MEMPMEMEEEEEMEKEMDATARPEQQTGVEARASQQWTVQCGMPLCCRIILLARSAAEKDWAIRSC